MDILRLFFFFGTTKSTTKREKKKRALVVAFFFLRKGRILGFRTKSKKGEKIARSKKAAFLNSKSLAFWASQKIKSSLPWWTR